MDRPFPQGSHAGPPSRVGGFLRTLPKPVRLLLILEAVLLFAFAVLFTYAWRQLPPEGVKLHGNIDTGVDLLGRKVELVWVAALAALVTVGNSGLAAWLKSRDPAAALFLFGSTLPLLAGFAGALLFILRLNAP